jgi:hypothetical protein
MDFRWGPFLPSTKKRRKKRILDSTRRFRSLSGLYCPDQYVGLFLCSSFNSLERQHLHRSSALRV